MLDINAKVEYYRAKNELLQLALDSVELYEKLLEETESGDVMRDSYKASLATWRLLVDEL